MAKRGECEDVVSDRLMVVSCGDGFVGVWRVEEYLDGGAYIYHENLGSSAEYVMIKGDFISFVNGNTGELTVLHYMRIDDTGGGTWLLQAGKYDLVKGVEISNQPLELEHHEAMKQDHPFMDHPELYEQNDYQKLLIAVLTKHFEGKYYKGSIY